MKIVNNYRPEKAVTEKLNRERCNTAGSIYRLDLSCNRISTYNHEYAKPEDYKFGNVFAFKSEAEKVLNEIPRLYALFSQSPDKNKNSEVSGKAVYFILDSGSIAEIKRDDMPEINKKNKNTGLYEWTFEQYIQPWFNAGNCFTTLVQAAAARDRLADIFEAVKQNRQK